MSPLLACWCWLQQIPRFELPGGFALLAFYRIHKWGSAVGRLDTFAERARAYHGVCGSLAADLAFSSIAFFAFAVCAGTETAITTLWPWKVREYAQREYEKESGYEKNM